MQGISFGGRNCRIWKMTWSGRSRGGDVAECGRGWVRGWAGRLGDVLPLRRASGCLALSADLHCAGERAGTLPADVEPVESMGRAQTWKGIRRRDVGTITCDVASYKGMNVEARFT